MVSGFSISDKGATKLKQSISQKKMIQLLVGVIIVLAVAIVGVILFQHSVFERVKSPAFVEEVDFASITDTDLKTSMEEDIKTPGYYTYPANETESYVLLTFGETANLVMNVSPEIDGRSVYFKIGFTEISENEPHVEAHLYLTDAEAIGGDEAYLVFPGYGVGASGYNTGWSDKLEDGKCYVTPLEETRIIDRVCIPDAGVDMGTGFYNYEYEVTSSGARIKSATKLDNYKVWCHIENIDEENSKCLLLVGDEQVSFTVWFNPDALSTVQMMADSETEKKVLIYNDNGKPMLGIDAPVSTVEETEVPADGE